MCTIVRQVVFLRIIIILLLYIIEQLQCSRSIHLLGEYLCVHNHWATISVQNCRIMQIIILTFKKKEKSVTNMAALLFNNSHKPSIHGVCQFLHLLKINFHSLPDTVQRVALFSFTVNLPFKKRQQVVNRV